MNKQSNTNDYSNLFVGLDTLVPTLSGKMQRYINFDNAASTPALQAVEQSIVKFLKYYSSVHRGTGFKSQLSTHFYEDARKTVLDFLGADDQEHTCIFGKNTTEAVNKLAHRFPYTDKRNIILTTVMEHHSNDLPWRQVARVIHADLTPEKKLDEKAFDKLLEKYGDQIALVAITGASNVTGFLNPIHRIAEKAHKVGAQIFVDAAQLAPHRKINMLPLSDPKHLDYVAISAHKMYAPFGTGALIGRKDTFEKGEPDLVGGGTIELVTLDKVTWSNPPDKEEAGSPNVLGAIALAASIHQLQRIGMDAVAAHEAELTSYILERLNKIDGISVYGDTRPENAPNRLGVVPVNLRGISHFKVAAILGYEFGIGVRNGCFCAHPYLLNLLGFNEQEAEDVRERMRKGDRSDMPGLVRISFGLYNTTDEIDSLITALKAVLKGNYQGDYVQKISTGEYFPRNWQPDYSQYFSY